MPVIPSFSSFAPAPNLASSFLGGVKIAQEGQQENERLAQGRQRIAEQSQSDAARLAQAAASHAQQFQIARERIASSQVENQMRLEARQKIVDQQALQKSHEAAIDAAVKNTQLGLAERRLQAQESVVKIRIQEAADSMARQFKYDQVIAAGGTPEEGIRAAGLGARGLSEVIGGRFSGANKPPPMDTITETIPAQEGRPAVEGIPARKRSLLGIDWLMPDVKAVEAQPAIPEHGKQTITRRIPNMTATNAPPRGLSIPEGLSRTNSTKRLKYNPDTGRLE